MSIQTRALGHSYLLDAELPAMLRTLEDYVSMPYDDRAQSRPGSPGHIPTVGIGINLLVRSNLALVLNKFEVFDVSDLGAPPNETTAQKHSRYKAILDDFYDVIRAHTPLSRAQNQLPGTSQSEQDLLAALNAELLAHGVNGRTFQFGDVDEAKEVKREYILGFNIGGFQGPDADFIDLGAQYRLDRILDGTGIGHDTYEYKALMSLYFNNPSLIGARLKRAIQNGDRAEAWFEIRYASNGEWFTGTARRRAYEATVFGLYSGSTVSSAEALSAYRMLQLHRPAINYYEQTWAVAIAAADSIYQGINQQTGESFTDHVKEFNESFNPARNAIVSDLNNQFSGLGLTASDYNPKNIYVDPGRADSSSELDPDRGAFLDSRVRNSSGAETASKDILIGEGGNGVLMGGKGDDVLVGGTGNDAYIWNLGDGSDKIADADGQGILVRGRCVLRNRFRRLGDARSGVSDHERLRLAADNP